MIVRDGSRLRVQGPVTIGNVMSVLEGGLQQLNPELKQIDFSELDEVDSAAISMVLEWLRVSKSRNLQLCVVNMPDNMKSLASVYGVLELIPFCGEGQEPKELAIGKRTIRFLSYLPGFTPQHDT
jgi:phospholipid transport system transporter-binding protein